MKAAAAQAGIDPALVERAAKLLAGGATAPPTFLERLLGGRARYSSETDVGIALDEAGLAQLLSAIRIAVGRSGESHASDLGLTWRSSEDGGGVLNLTAVVDQQSTVVRAELDRRGTLVLVTGATGVVSFVAFVFGGGLTHELVPGFEIVGALLGVSGVVAAARSYWKASTRSARERLGRVMDSVGRFLNRTQNATTAEDEAASTTSDSERSGHAD